MSVARSTYRQILKHAHKASLKYKEPDELCFAMYGLILRMDDFRAAGYGQTRQEVIRALFERPSITGLTSDISTARLLAGFDALRRLSSLVSSKTHRYHFSEERKRDTISQPGSLQSQTRGKCTADIIEIDKAEDDKKNDDNNNDDEDEDGDEDDDVTVARGTVFIESSLSRKVVKLSRHVVVCKDTQQFPPYRYIMPPEPLYAKNTRVSFKFSLMEDAMLCMSSSGSTRDEGHQPSNLAKTRLTREDYRGICDHIPTRTITITDHIEVELRTEHVCSRNPDEDGASDEDDDDDDNRRDAQTSSFGASNTTGNSGNTATTTSTTTTMESGNGSMMTRNMNRKEHIFRYFVFIRNYGHSRNEKKWHVQLLSRHWVFFDEEVGLVVEVVGPGVTGNFPLLAPGESHIYESGASLCGASGVMRGTFQLNAYNEEGETRCLDVHISPTRLSVRESKK